MGRVARLTKKYQISIPSEIRKKLQIQAGDYIYLDVVNENVILRVIPGEVTEYMAGLGKEVWEKLGGGETFIREERSTWK